MCGGMDLKIIVNYYSFFIIFEWISGIFGNDEIASVTKAPGMPPSSQKITPCLCMYAFLEFTCAHCASSRSITHQREVLDALDQFLDVRGGIHYPFDSIDSNCNRPRNISLVRNRQKCLTNYCYSITFRDNQGRV